MHHVVMCLMVCAFLYMGHRMFRRAVASQELANMYVPCVQERAIMSLVFGRVGCRDWEGGMERCACIHCCLLISSSLSVHLPLSLFSRTSLALLSLSLSLSLCPSPSLALLFLSLSRARSLLARSLPSRSLAISLSRSFVRPPTRPLSLYRSSAAARKSYGASSSNIV